MAGELRAFVVAPGRDAPFSRSDPEEVRTSNASMSARVTSAR
jgi:hypothetical protein